MFTNSDASIKKFTAREKFEIGYSMLLGHAYSEIGEKYDVSQSYAYELRGYAEKVLSNMEQPVPDAPTVVLTRQLQERMVIALALHCRAPLEGIWRFFDEIFGIGMSVSRASLIITKAAEKAAEWDRGVSLENIRQGANDEIFQCGKPVFSGIDAVSTYTYLLEEKPDRKGATWQSAMEDAKSHGLNLEVIISDQGTGLLSGVPKAFPEADIQYDVFHEMMEFRKELTRMERRAFGFIRKEYGWEEKTDAYPRDRKYRTWLKEAREWSAVYAGAFDDMGILLGWFQELLGFSGYSAKESMDLAQWVVDCMEETAQRVKEYDFRYKIKGLRDKLPQLLGFVRRLQSMMDEKAAARNLPVEAYHILYHLKTHAEGTPEYFHLSRRVDRLLKNQRRDVEAELKELIWLTKRASSLVENLNSRIRMYVNLKRVIPQKFFALMKVFFNTKKYRRSAIDSRVDKSPIELLTGKEYPDFFELLGF